MQKHKTCGITPAFLTFQSLFLCTDVPTTHTLWRHTHVHTPQQTVVPPLLVGHFKVICTRAILLPHFQGSLAMPGDSFGCYDLG